MANKSIKKRQTKRSMPQSAQSPQSAPHISRRLVDRRFSVMIPVVLFSGAVFLFFMPSNSWGGSSPSLLDLSHKVHEIDVLAEFPHDPEAFTQGLLYTGNDTLYESTGLYGKSSVRKVALRTGKVEALRKMDDAYFGEGLTLLGERLFQLTWLNTTGFIYDLHDLRMVKPFTHQMEDGWGLATDGKVLFGSDGTSKLYWIDPQTLKVTRKRTVTYNGREVRYLNELEYINGEVWANVWQTDCIVRLSPRDGSILGWILLPNLRLGLLKSGYKDIDVLNGIAWDGDKQRLFVTGKLWPKLYQIKLKPATKPASSFIERHCLV